MSNSFLEWLNQLTSLHSTINIWKFRWSHIFQYFLWLEFKYYPTRWVCSCTSLSFNLNNLDCVLLSLNVFTCIIGHLDILLCELSVKFFPFSYWAVCCCCFSLLNCNISFYIWPLFVKCVASVFFSLWLSFFFSYVS